MISAILVRFKAICSTLQSVILRNLVAISSNRKNSASEGFKMYNLGTFFYTQGLSKVLVEILSGERQRLKKSLFSIVFHLGILHTNYLKKTHFDIFMIN